MLTIGPLKKRKSVKLGERDVSEGYDARMSARGLKTYTVIQNITTELSWEDRNEAGGEPRRSFSEAWHSGRGMILDAFLVPRFYRHRARGSMDVFAEAWVLPGHVTFKSLGMRKGRLGKDPWGEAYGNKGHACIPVGTHVVRRNVRIQWDNLDKGYEDEYEGGRDLRVRSKRREFTKK